MSPLKAQLLLEESLSAYFPEMVFTDSGITVQLHRNTQRCLDALFDADVSTLYQVMAAQVVERLGLKSTAVHLDITSFHV
ncbi:hypothetical protein ACEUD2_20420, partial [Aeromonas veronii]